jgi:VWFA-related protein
MTRRLAIVALVVAAAAVGAVRPSAQSPPAGQAGSAQQPTFRARIDSVSVDVAVTDKEGKPVADLTAEDFEVRESKQLQAVTAFKFIRIDDVEDAGPAPSILSSSDQERELTRDDTRLMVIFLDDYHVRRVNSLRTRVQLATFIRQLSRHDMVAVAAPLTAPAALTFSYDHDATARIVMAFEGRKYDYAPRNAFEAQLQMMAPEQIEAVRNGMVTSALESVCAYMGTLRPGRKTLLYVSEGMSGTLGAGIGATIGQAGSSRASATPNLVNAMDLQHDMNRVYIAASRANTSISTLDPRGLVSSEFTAGDPVSSIYDQQILSESMDLLRTIASQTDGRAIVGRNEAGADLRQMMRELGAYYMLGYTTSALHDGKFHEIQVRVKRKDVTVHARKGYWAYTEEELAKASAPPRPPLDRDVVEAIGALETSDAIANRRVVQAWMGAARGAGDQAVVTFVWEATSGGAPVDPADAVDHVMVTASAMGGSQLYSGRVAGDPQAARATGSVTFEAPAGSVRVRFIAENAQGVRLESNDETLDVPDFTSTALAILAPVVYRARTARDVQQIRAAAAPLPAVSREFSRTERLLLRFRVAAPAGAAPVVAMRLLSQQGTAMAALPAPSVTGPGAYETEVGLGPLPKGSYLIEITAELGGEKIRRLLGIKVTG